MVASDPWASGDEYEPYVGRWSRLVASEFLGWLAISPGRRWLDIGCGTGALTETILHRCEPIAVVGVDPSEAYVSHVRRRIRDERAAFQVRDAQQLPDDLEQFDVAVSGLVLNFIPDVGTALSEMTRVVKPGAIVAAYVWDYAGKVEFMRYFWDAASHLYPEAEQLDEGRRFPICQPDALASLFEERFSEVTVTGLMVTTQFRDFDDYWNPFLGGQGPAPSYAMSLTAEQRNRLRDLIRERLPIAGDGSIELQARAWAVRGRRQ